MVASWSTYTDHPCSLVEAAPDQRQRTLLGGSGHLQDHLSIMTHHDPLHLRHAGSLQLTKRKLTTVSKLTTVLWVEKAKAKKVGG